ncbi:hypothetical protein BLJAPNOD_02938 [Ensifer sp. M14]|uniref:GrlR family regulatory protein n=1 Tax=Ensifer sp. M14 TaxID=2203782 RepID=UPI000E1CBCEA|nr:GrlR family regulatory protein [Ensifer sp. M14]RDL51797.1 hypothetical protein BLJAPNOD_02938 [Ensifer sp. M14]
MRQGLYRASFYLTDPRTGLMGDEFGRGVVDIRDGSIRGGDSNYYYAGTYSLDGTKLDATIAVTPHTPRPLGLTPFERGATLTIRGTADAVGIRCGGEISTSPGDGIQIGLTWLVE